jgi:nucleoside-diphosphate-sugar epimerase
MKILIIGAEGYIGSILQKYLSNENYSVDCYGNKSLDFNLLSKEFIQNYTHIILLAGHSSVQACNGPLKASWNNNVRNFHTLIEKTHIDQHIIYASSSSVYGGSKGKLCTENDISFEYMNNYDLTKITLDQVANNFILSNRKIIGLRFGTVNGSSPIIRGDLLVNSMTLSAHKTNIINLSNSNINRPLLSITDLSRSIKAILVGKWKSGIYNLATTNKTIKEYADIVSNVTSAKIIDHGNTNGVYDFQISSDLFNKTFEFEFVDTVENIVESLLDSYKNNQKIVLRNEYYDYKG